MIKARMEARPKYVNILSGKEVNIYSKYCTKSKKLLMPSLKLNIAKDC